MTAIIPTHQIVNNLEQKRDVLVKLVYSVAQFIYLLTNKIEPLGHPIQPLLMVLGQLG